MEPDHSEVNRYNNVISYENIPDSSIASTNNRTQTEDRERYEILRLDNEQKRNVKTGTQDKTLKQLRCVIYILTVLIVVLYIIIFALIIILFSHKDPVDGIWTKWSSWTSCDVTCGNGTLLRTRTCSNPVPAYDGKFCIGENLQSRPCSKDKCIAFMSAFSVTQPRDYSITGLTFSSTIYQYGSDFNISTGTYTCRIPDVYQFSVTLIKKRGNAKAKRVLCALYKNTRFLINIRIDQADEDTEERSAAVSQSIVIDLEIGDTVYLSSCNGQPNVFMEPWSSFTGFLIFRT